MKTNKNFLLFLGTSGARYATIKQLRRSTGIWIRFGKTNILIDPGPGTLINILNSKQGLNPEELDAIILTHKHIDHSSDINIMIEAMTYGGKKKRGLLIAPKDAFGKQGVIFSYLKKFPKKIILLKKSLRLKIKELSLDIPSKLKHSVETYGIKFTFNKRKLSIISDTEFFPEISSLYNANIVIINVVLEEDLPGVKHLSLNGAKKIIQKINAEKTILTHFGIHIIKNNPKFLEQKIKKEIKKDIIFAKDNLCLPL